MQRNTDDVLPELLLALLPLPLHLLLHKTLNHKMQEPLVYFKPLDHEPNQVDSLNLKPSTLR